MENTHLDPAAQSGTACTQEQEQTIVVETTQVETPQMSRADIIERIRQIVEAPIEEVKDEVETLKQNYYKVKRAEVEAAYKIHIESGLSEAEFTPLHDEYEEEPPRRRTSRFADDDEGYSRRSSRSDTGEVYVPRRAAKR